MVDQVDPQTLARWLEWAAVRLIAMPAGRIYPDQPRALWPDYVRDPLAGVSDLRVNKIRALAPSSAEIPIIDLIILLPNLSTHKETRQIIHWRAQVHPIRQTHLLTWDWIAKKLHVRKFTAQNWHKIGLQEVAEKVPPEIVWRITTFLDDHP